MKQSRYKKGLSFEQVLEDNKCTLEEAVKCEQYLQFLRIRPLLNIPQVKHKSKEYILSNTINKQ